MQRNQGVIRPEDFRGESRETSKEASVAVELKHVQKLQVGLVDKGQRATELMFGVFEEAASAGGEQSPETVDAAPAAEGGTWRAAVGWEGLAAAPPHFRA